MPKLVVEIDTPTGHPNEVDYMVFTLVGETTEARFSEEPRMLSITKPVAGRRTPTPMEGLRGQLTQDVLALEGAREVRISPQQLAV